MKAEIITVGTELMIGSTLNTNGPYLSRKLTDQGIEVAYHQSISDGREVIEEALRIALGRSDLIFLGGGLGPTQDDQTKEIVAKSLGRKLIRDKDLEEDLRRYFSSRNYKMTQNNLKQADIIQGSQIIQNKNGTAVGECLALDRGYLYLLPGPPREFEPMVDDLVANYLPKGDFDIYLKSIQVMLLGESTIESRLRELGLESPETSINTFAKLGEVEIKIISKLLREDPDKAEKLAYHERVIQELKKEFAPFIYSEEGEDLAQALVQKLIKKGQRISFAESITGGRLAQKITSVPGASKILKSSYVTYSNEYKIKDLGVSQDLLARKGAVCQEVADEMALGLYKRTGADLSLGTTGEAGPISNENKPIGTLYFSIAHQGKLVEGKKLDLRGDRQSIQEKGTILVLSHLMAYLKRGENHDQ
ncbi:MAG: competence/damage-inducible protein A [Tissierellia bacterium]|nr:competence/damage-inducible protein A [Tissierellia bacterium]